MMEEHFDRSKLYALVPYYGTEPKSWLIVGPCRFTPQRVYYPRRGGGESYDKTASIIQTFDTAEIARSARAAAQAEWERRQQRIDDLHAALMVASAAHREAEIGRRADTRAIAREHVGT